MRTRRFMIAFIAGCFLVPATAPAEGLAWTTADGSGSCNPPLIVVCEYGASGNAATGAASLSLFLGSRLQGYAPAQGSGNANVTFATNYNLEQNASSITVHATIRVREASLETVHRLGGLAPGPSGAIAGSMQVDAQCFGCFNFGGVIILEQPGSIADQDLDITVTMMPFDPEPIEAGPILVRGFLDIFGTMGTFGVGIGSLAASTDSTFTVTGVDFVPA